MTRARPYRTALAVLAVASCLLPISGCGFFSRFTAKPSEAVQPSGGLPPVAVPAPAPPPLRLAGAQIADEESLKGLIQGRTTKSEVQERFGIPQEVVLSPGIETFIYYREKTIGWFSRTTERIEMLTVRFDAKGLLKDFEYRYSGK